MKLVTIANVDDLAPQRGSFAIQRRQQQQSQITSIGRSGLSTGRKGFLQAAVGDDPNDGFTQDLVNCAHLRFENITFRDNGLVISDASPGCLQWITISNCKLGFLRGGSFNKFNATRLTIMDSELSLASEAFTNVNVNRFEMSNNTIRRVEVDAVSDQGVRIFEVASIRGNRFTGSVVSAQAFKLGQVNHFYFTENTIAADFLDEQFVSVSLACSGIVTNNYFKTFQPGAFTGVEAADGAHHPVTLTVAGNTFELIPTSQLLISQATTGQFFARCRSMMYIEAFCC